jgi:hypothetical protein
VPWARHAIGGNCAALAGAKETFVMRHKSRKNLRLLIGHFRSMLGRSVLDPGQKADATRLFSSFIRAAARKDTRGATIALESVLEILLRRKE